MKRAKTCSFRQSEAPTRVRAKLPYYQLHHVASCVPRGLTRVMTGHPGLCPPGAVHQQAACRPVLRAHRRQRHQQHALQPQAFMDASQGIPSDGLVGRPVSPPLSAERTLEEAGKIAASANALISLCRLHNLVPSAVLVLLGAWVSGPLAGCVLCERS